EMLSSLMDRAYRSPLAHDRELQPLSGRAHAGCDRLDHERVPAGAELLPAREPALEPDGVAPGVPGEAQRPALQRALRLARVAPGPGDAPALHPPAGARLGEAEAHPRRAVERVPERGSDRRPPRARLGEPGLARDPEPGMALAGAGDVRQRGARR